MKRFYAGLDVGSSVCELVGINVLGQKVFAKKFSPSERNLIDAAQEVRQRFPGELHLAIEEGEMAQWVAGVLRSEVTRLVVCDPKHNAWIAKDPQKNDTVDATKLAQLLRGGYVQEVYHGEDEDRVEFKRAVRQYHQLTALQASLRCQIKSKYRAHGIIPKGDRVFHPDRREEWLTRLPDSSRAMVTHVYGLLDSALQAQSQALRLIKAMGRKYGEIKLFQEVPGIGAIWACTFSAYVQTPFRFKNRRKFWRYCRLGVTHQMTNAAPIGGQRLDPNGVGLLKQLSYRAFGAAMHAKENEFKEHYQASLKRTRNATHARLNTQRKILLVLWTMWKHMHPYRPFGRNEEKLKERD